MSGLIRSTSERAGSVRSMTPPVRDGVALVVGDPLMLERDALAAEVARLRDFAHDMEQRLAEAGREIEAAYARGRQDGETAGRAEGLAQGAARSAAGLDRLEAGIHNAHAAFRARLEDTDRLAAALAEVAVERVLGAGASQETVIAATLRTAAGRLGAQAVVEVLVSPRDFPDVAALASLGEALQSALPEVRLAAAVDLGPGECRFALQLGEELVGPAQQWRVLAAELIRQAEGGA